MNRTLEPRLLPPVAGYAVGLYAHRRWRPDDVESVTHRELAIIFTGIAGALVASTLLVPSLAASLLVAVAALAAELRLARPPPERAPA
jgi:hypothetical protein